MIKTAGSPIFWKKSNVDTRIQYMQGIGKFNNYKQSKIWHND